ncbi:hypothetical protein ABTX81_34865 [Kitasatospora sp. NPDC097605]|uniref:hypothetical protein n=1 Tax=Kitasatospora sp. NPDC097605 TaxID=3157226 RepID=UPI003323FB9B
MPSDAPPDRRQVWLPAEFTHLAGLPDSLRYAHWDGRSPFPSDPGVAEFCVPPLVQDVGVIGRPLERMTGCGPSRRSAREPTGWGRGRAGCRGR